MNHNDFLNRKRRLILQEDANMPLGLPVDMPIGDWIKHRFDPWEGSMVDAVAWDIGLESEAYRVYLKGSLPLRDYPRVEYWRDQGVDWLEHCVKACKERNMDVFWNHRISEVDLYHPLGADGFRAPHADPGRENYLKKEHPDWLIECWWPQGLWNLANAELRQHKLKFLREIVTNYELDGLQLDFARHTPCLPPGHEWENREHVTEFIRMVRKMLNEVETTSGRPQLLLARVGETIAGNHVDGYEVEKWIAEGLIDILIPGGRAAAIEIRRFLQLPGGDKIKIYPSMDSHHTAEGYHRAPMEYFRGLFVNWLEQGASSISLFNWLGDGEVHEPFHQVLKECGDRALMSKLPKMYAAESRGEYPWAGNYVYRCDDKILPLNTAHGGGALIPIEVSFPEPLNELMIMVENMGEADIEEIRLNGTLLERKSFEPSYPDKGFGFRRQDVVNFPAAFYRIPPDITLKDGRNLVSVLFRANMHPVLFAIRRVELWNRG